MGLHCNCYHGSDCYHWLVSVIAVIAGAASAVDRHRRITCTVHAVQVGMIQDGHREAPTYQHKKMVTVKLLPTNTRRWSPWSSYLPTQEDGHREAPTYQHKKMVTVKLLPPNTRRWSPWSSYLPTQEDGHREAPTYQHKKMVTVKLLRTNTTQNLPECVCVCVCVCVCAPNHRAVISGSQFQLHTAHHCNHPRGSVLEQLKSQVNFSGISLKWVPVAYGIPSMWNCTVPTL